MALRIIGAGLGRTGTASIKVALERLGVGRCYHMGEVMNDVPCIEHWVRAAKGAPDWERIFAGYQAAVDYPALRAEQRRVPLRILDEDHHLRPHVLGALIARDEHVRQVATVAAELFRVADAQEARLRAVQGVRDQGV